MESSHDSVVRIALLGCGNVGAALVELLSDPARREELRQRTNLDLQLVGIGVRDLNKQRSSASWFPSDLVTDDLDGLLGRDDIDLVVELLGGIEPAAGFIRSSLEHGRPVVSANKALLAEQGVALSALAADNGVDLNFEAAVAGAVPVIRTLRISLAGESVNRVLGIVNGTTNYILSTMAKEGSDYAHVLGDAIALGLAEADPTADVEGFDAAAKAAILAGLAFGSVVPLDQVFREGITKIRSVDMAFARQFGYCIKLLAIAERVGDDEMSVRVHPAMVPLSHPLAQVDGAYNAVFIEGMAAGSLMLYGQGAGGMPTASAVLGDIIDAARNEATKSPAPALSNDANYSVIALDSLTSEFYISLDVVDHSGVLAQVTKVFGDHNVSIRSMEQVGIGEEARLIFLTHEATERDLAATIHDLEALSVVDAVGGVIRVIGQSEDL